MRGAGRAPGIVRVVVAKVVSLAVGQMGRYRTIDTA